jgi:hypothetical protein
VARAVRGEEEKGRKEEEERDEVAAWQVGPARQRLACGLRWQAGRRPVGGPRMGQKVWRADLEVAGPSWVWKFFLFSQTYTLIKLEFKFEFNSNLNSPE